MLFRDSNLFSTIFVEKIWITLQDPCFTAKKPSFYSKLKLYLKYASISNPLPMKWLSRAGESELEKRFGGIES